MYRVLTNVELRRKSIAVLLPWIPDRVYNVLALMVHSKVQSIKITFIVVMASFVLSSIK